MRNLFTALGIVCVKVAFIILCAWLFSKLSTTLLIVLMLILICFDILITYDEIDYREGFEENEENDELEY